MTPLLSVRNLRISFQIRRQTVTPVDGVSFDLEAGKVLGIVGESGSGKSLTSLALLGLLPEGGRVSAGEVFFDGRELTKLTQAEWRAIRGRDIGMIFQDPMTSLNPYLRISEQIMESTMLHRGYTRPQAFEHAVKMLETVGIPDARARANSHPHQFSGGMRQRVMIAMALACEPKLLIADEPTTALDVSIQAQILDLMRSIRHRTSSAMILISHDLDVVAGLADHVIVMYAGRVMESAPARELLSRPRNPYTRALMACRPDPAKPGEKLLSIGGLPPNPALISQQSCPFAERCPQVISQCAQHYPPWQALEASHSSLCWVNPS